MSVRTFRRPDGFPRWEIRMPAWCWWGVGKEWRILLSKPERGDGDDQEQGVEIDVEGLGGYYAVGQGSRRMTGGREG